MTSTDLKPQDKIYFFAEAQPMTIRAINERYAVCTRYLDIDDDFELIWHEVERGAYPDVQTAYETIKVTPIYSLLDFEKMKKAPSDRLFNPFDYRLQEDCEKCLRELASGAHSLSRRRGVDLLIDWQRTKMHKEAN